MAKSTVSSRLTSKYGGAAAAAAQGDVTRLTSQRDVLNSRIQEQSKSTLPDGRLSDYQKIAMDKLEAERKALDSQIVSAQSRVDNPLSGIDVKQRDIIKGAEFGETVLGDGLGRASDDKDIQAGMAALREQAQGFSSGEALARREQAIGNLNTAQEGQRRKLQAALARAGVRGGVAGNQLAMQATDAIGQRANMERDLFLSGEQARRSGTQNLLTAAGELNRFDLGQAAKEKNIVLQSGMGFAQMGAAERGAKMQADASRAAAASRSSSSCHIGGTQVRMADGKYKAIEDIKVGDEVHLGGKVKVHGTAIAEDNIYLFKGEYVTGTHVVFSELHNKYVCVKELNCQKTDLSTDTLVYPMTTEYGFYITKSGVVHGDFLTEEQEEGVGLKRARKRQFEKFNDTKVSKNN